MENFCCIPGHRGKGMPPSITVAASGNAIANGTAAVGFDAPRSLSAPSSRGKR